MNLHNSSKEISMAQATYCVRHPTTESNLACGRCGDGVCHRCVVHAPGGQRCPDCAQARPLPTFDLSGSVIARGLGAGLTIAVVGGILASVAYILLFNSGAPSNLVTGAGAGLVALMGLGVGEGISLAVNRKRGRRLKLVAGFSMFVGITVVTLVSGATYNTLILLASGLSFYIAVNKF